jgi:hypothetical protein
MRFRPFVHSRREFHCVALTQHTEEALIKHYASDPCLRVSTQVRPTD